MAQIHALTPEGRLPTAAVEHVQEITGSRTTGWRDFTDLIDHPHLGGRALIKREGDTVTIAFDELDLDVTGNISFPRLPSGFGPISRVMATWYYSNSSIPPEGVVNISTGGYFNVYNTNDRAMVALFHFETSQGWPSTLPGDPA